MRPLLLVPMTLLAIAAASCSTKTAMSEPPTSTPAPVTETAPATESSETAATTAPSEAATPAAETALLAVYVQDSVAIAGADPVAYFTDSAYVPGTSEFSHEWSGATWHFASAENRDAFAANPEQYAPQYGGFCAWAVSQGYSAAVDPEAWKIVDGKLYLNYDQNVQARWARDIPGNIAKADTNWPEVAANE